MSRSIARVALVALFLCLANLTAGADELRALIEDLPERRHRKILRHRPISSNPSPR